MTQVHFSGIKKEGYKSLADGEAVEFDVETDPRSGKPRAVRRARSAGRDALARAGSESGVAAFTPVDSYKTCVAMLPAAFESITMQC